MPSHTGPKAFGAMPALDNGFMRLNHVHIPLSAMLSKFASVTAEGKYNVPVHSKLSYGGVSQSLQLSYNLPLDSWLPRWCI